MTLSKGFKKPLLMKKVLGKQETYVITPLKEYSGNEIREIREKNGMTQRVFASFMGVSPKTIEAWEGGRTHPSGPAFRLLDMLSKKEIDDARYVIAK